MYDALRRLLRLAARDAPDLLLGNQDVEGDIVGFGGNVVEEALRIDHPDGRDAEPGEEEVVIPPPVPDAVAVAPGPQGRDYDGVERLDRHVVRAHGLRDPPAVRLHPLLAFEPDVAEQRASRDGRYDGQDDGLPFGLEVVDQRARVYFVPGSDGPEHVDGVRSADLREQGDLRPDARTVRGDVGLGEGEAGGGEALAERLLGGDGIFVLHAGSLANRG